MPTIINRNIYTQIDHDSGSLTDSWTLVHQFSDAGEYHGLLQNSRGGTIGAFTISVSGATAGASARGAKAKGGAPHMTKVEIDLKNLQTSEGDADGDGGAPEFSVEAGGYAVFRVPPGASGGFAVEVYKAGEAGGYGAKVFDSRRLKEEDILAVVLLRPGTYSLVNAINDTKAAVTVAYPEKMAKMSEPVKVRCAKDGITPAKIKVHSTQGLVFSFETPTRIKIDLVTPDDRPRRPPHTEGSAPKQKGSQKGEAATGSTHAKKKRKKVARMLAMVPRPSSP